VQTKQQLREAAAKRAEDRASITDQQQLEKLDFLHGKGLGASKERAKLLKRIEAAQKVVKQDEEAPVKRGKGGKKRK